MSTWYDYVTRVAGTTTQSQIERETGIGQSNLSRWKSGGVPSHEHASRVARSYGRPVLEAFVAAGLLTAEEANAEIVAEPSMDQISDQTLLEEVAYRLAHRAQAVELYMASGRLSDREFTDAEVIQLARQVRETNASDRKRTLSSAIAALDDESIAGEQESQNEP